MSLAKEILQGGFSAGQAKAVGGAYTTVAAAGSVIGDATPVTASNCVVTGADGTKGVSIAGEVGDVITIFNSAASTLKVWPEAAAAISVSGTGLGTTAAAGSLVAQKSAVYRKFTTTQWIVVLSA
jgi:hypothetical protein